jgi:hypothetical protein
MISADLAETLAVIVFLFILLTIAAYIGVRSRPVHWILIGKYGSDPYGNPYYLYETLNAVRKEWRYLKGTQWIYPSMAELAMNGSDMQGYPLILD